MSEYILDVNVLQKGDIILIRDNSNESKRIREVSKSDYHHAMIYRSEYSYIESDGTGVQAKNIQRKLFADQTDAVVLRPLNKPNDNVIHQIVEFTGRKVGTEYSTAEARRATIFADRPAMEPNLQYCTRLVAQAYETAGIKIVPNPDYCTPQQILESAILQRIDGALKIATLQDVSLAEEKNTATDLMEDATNALFDAVRHKFGDEVQNFEQLSNFVVNHPADEPQIFQMLLDSGYLKVWEQEEQLNPQQYVYDQFMAYFNEEPAQYWAAGKLMIGADQQIEFYLRQIIFAKINFERHPMPYFKSFVDLLKNYTCF